MLSGAKSTHALMHFQAIVCILIHTLYGWRINVHVEKYNEVKNSHACICTFIHLCAILSYFLFFSDGCWRDGHFWLVKSLLNKKYNKVKHSEHLYPTLVLTLSLRLLIGVILNNHAYRIHSYHQQEWSSLSFSFIHTIYDLFIHTIYDVCYFWILWQRINAQLFAEEFNSDSGHFYGT